MVDLRIRSLLKLLQSYTGYREFRLLRTILLRMEWLNVAIDLSQRAFRSGRMVALKDGLVVLRPTFSLNVLRSTNLLELPPSTLYTADRQFCLLKLSSLLGESSIGTRFEHGRSLSLCGPDSLSCATLISKS